MSADQLRQIIVNQLDLEQLPSDMQGAILVRLTELSLQQFMLDAYDALSADDQRTLKKYFASGDMVEMRSWLSSNLDNMNEIADGSVSKVVAQYQKMRLETAAT